MSIEKMQRMNPHHAISAPLGMMRYEDDGDYVRYLAARAREDALLEQLKLAAERVRDLEYLLSAVKERLGDFGVGLIVRPGKYGEDSARDTIRKIESTR